MFILMAQFEATVRAALASQYAVARTLGAGGMATVFLATDLRHGNRQVAIKVLRPELAAALGVDRFLSEIRLAANMQHPHILPLFDSGTVGTLPFYVMPWVDGESLRDKLAREAQLRISDAIRITTQIASALAYAHDHGVIHRDVKPENILLSGDNALLADFGIAHAVLEVGGAKLTSTGIVIGTPAYMSPEQAAAAVIDARTDIYSLGCVLYEMLAGDPPFTGSSAHAIVARKSVEPVPALRHVREAVSVGLEAVVLKALSRTPADRHDSAAAFAAALHAPDDRLPRPSGSRRRRVVLAGVSAVIALVAIALAVTRPRDRGDERRILVTSARNETSDPALEQIGGIARDWLIRELQNTGLVEVVDQGALLRGHDSEPARLARETHAGKFISLSYYKLGDSVAFQTRIIESSSGVTLYTSQLTAAPLATPLSRLEDVSQRLVGAVVTLVAPGAAWRSEHPPTFAAYKEYVAGLGALSTLDFPTAIEHWFRSARFDTTFVTPLLEAASFMLVDGQNARADSLVSSIEQRQDRLNNLERQRLANLRARLRGNLSAALVALQPLAEAAPLSEAKWELVVHLLWVNQPGPAIVAFSELDPSWQFMRGWFFYWLFYCYAHHVRRDYNAELALGRQGRTQYPHSMQMPEGELAALAALGRMDEFNRVLDEMAARPADRPGALALLIIRGAEELRAHGDRDAYIATIQRAHAEVLQWSPQVRATAPPWLAATIAYVSEDLDNAQRLFAELAGRDSTDFNVQGHLGVIAARRGNRGEALRISAWLERRDATYLYGYNTLWQARIAALLGDRARAVELLRIAFSQGLKHVGTFRQDWPARTFGPWVHRDLDFESIRNMPSFQQLTTPTP